MPRIGNMQQFLDTCTPHEQNLIGQIDQWCKRKSMKAEKQRPSWEEPRCKGRYFVDSKKTLCTNWGTMNRRLEQFPSPVRGGLEKLKGEILARAEKDHRFHVCETDGYKMALTYKTKPEQVEAFLELGWLVFAQARDLCLSTSNSFESS